MNRTIKTVLCTLSFVLLACATACDPQTEEPFASDQLDLSEIDLVIEQQLEEHDDLDLVCNTWPDADWQPEGAIAEHGLEPCIEWTDAAAELSLSAPDNQVPVAGCNVWQETKIVNTGHNCGAWGGGECSGPNCCTIYVDYARTCSACPPNVPTSCGGWNFVSSGCGCG